jgi:hypothetical protein
LLHEFITAHRYEILRRSVDQTAIPSSATEAVEHRAFLDELTKALRTGHSTSRLARVRFLHGLPPPGLTVSRVVWRDYCDIRDAITELALEKQVPLNLDEACQLDRYVDNAIIDAITESGRE